MLKKLKKIARLALQGVFLGQLKKQDLLNNKKKGKKKRQYLETKIQKSGTDIFKFLGGKGYEQ